MIYIILLIRRALLLRYYLFSELETAGVGHFIGAVDGCDFIQQYRQKQNGMVHASISEKLQTGAAENIGSFIVKETRELCNQFLCFLGSSGFRRGHGGQRIGETIVNLMFPCPA